MAAALALTAWWGPGRVPSSWSCNPKTGLLMHTVYTIHTHNMQDEEQTQKLRTPLLSLAHLSLHGPPGQNSELVKGCSAILWPGGRDVSRGGLGAWMNKIPGQAMKVKCVCVCSAVKRPMIVHLYGPPFYKVGIF